METRKAPTLLDELGKISTFSDSELEEQLSIYLDKVENLNSLISKINDRAAISHMEGQVRAYTMHWHTLFNERQKRVSILKKDTNIDLSNILFYSSNCVKTENHVQIEGALPKTNRLVKVENSIKDNKSHTVTIFNLSNNDKPTNDNIEFGPQEMRLNSFDKNRISLKGYGEIGSNDWNYGLGIFIKDNQIEKCTLFHTTMEKASSTQYLK